MASQPSPEYARTDAVDDWLRTRRRLSERVWPAVHKRGTRQQLQTGRLAYALF